MHDGATPVENGRGYPAIPDLTDIPIDTVLRASDPTVIDALLKMVENVPNASESYAAHSTSV